MRIELVPFQESLISQAGELLAQRHRRDRAIQPWLPIQFEDPALAQEAVSQELDRERSSAVAALNDGRLLGFMIGKMVLAQVWGRSAWVSLAGCALSPDQSRELVGRMYAVLGSEWEANGCFAHFAVVPAADAELVQAWFSLSFGIEQVYGLAKLDGVVEVPAVHPPVDLSIRVAAPEDRQVLEDLSGIIWRHQTGAPVWGICLPEDQHELRQGYADLAADPDATVWLAFYKGRAAGFQCCFPADPSGKGLIVPEQCIELSVAGALPEFQGLGIGQALTRHGMAYAYEHGCRNCLTDWRSTNLLSSRFWPLLGFQPVAYRLARRIDDRIAWAKG
jgi:ribosomal protein S18 acetylase RimI-like enzyme